MTDLQAVDIVKRRDFGLVISDLILVVRQNLGALFNLYLRYGLSVMVGGFVLALLLSNTSFGNFNLVGASNPLMIGSVLIIVIAYIVASYLFTVAVYAYVNAYIAWGKDEAIVKYRSGMGKVALKVLLAYLVVFAAYLVLVLFGGLMFGISIALGVLFIFALMPVVIFVMVYASLLPYAITLPAMTLGSAISMVITVIKGHWWWTFGLMIIVLLVGSVVMYIFMIPLYIIFGFGMVMGMSDPENFEGGMSFVIMYFLMYCGSLILSGIYALLQPLIYHSLHEEKFGSKLEEKIEEIKPKKDSFFENEGEL